MNKITYLIALLVLILAGCSSNSSTSTDSGDSSTTLSSSSIGIIPEMSSPVSSSSNEGISATSSTTPTSSTGGTSSTISSSGTQTSSSSTVVSKAPIALYKIGGLAKTLNVTGEMSSIPYNVDFDTIYGTTGFSFLVKNNSTSDITGLKFEFDKDYFKVTPDSIITLGAPSTETGIEQLIKVTVEHGTLASGYGFADVLTGNQYGVLTITGKNADGPFSVKYTMHVYAKRMIININVPDTVRSGTTIFTTVGGNGSVSDPSKYRYASVDPSSEDCYLNMGEITLDTSTHVVMADMKDYYSTFYSVATANAYIANGAGNVLLDSTANGIAIHNKIITELNGAKRMETYNYLDNNCVVLVNDNWPVTNPINFPDQWVKTQRIID